MTDMSFAQQLQVKSSKVVSDMQKSIEEVKDRCQKEAAKGHADTECFLQDFIGDPTELKQALEMIGLKMKQPRFVNKSLMVEVSWGPIQRKRANATTSSNPGKRRRLDGNESSSSPENFAMQLSKKSSAAIPDMQKYIEEVKDRCQKEAAKGHTDVDCFLQDFIGDPKEVMEELEMMGLKVKQPRFVNKSLMVQVSWPSSGSRQRVFQPSGLTSGNHQIECKVCFERETACRLHPCGHLIGACCGANVIDKKCPFCRTKVRFAHAVFEP